MKRHYVLNLDRSRDGSYEIHDIRCELVNLMPGLRFLGEHNSVFEAVAQAGKLGLSAIATCACCVADFINRQ